MENNTDEEKLHGQGEWVVRQSARGHTYRVWRRSERVPQIPQHYLDCSIYLYSSKKAAEKGENFGGSGFLVSIQPNPVFDPQLFDTGKRLSLFFSLPSHIYAVTNKHVAHGGYPVIRLNTVDDELDVLELNKDDWIPHPDGDDLAVASIELPKNKHHYYPINRGIFLERHELQILGAGDDVFMVGRFITHAGKQRNTPALRFGSISMLPFEEIRVGNHMQEAFLVETRSISGYSGSPVFVYRPAEKRVVSYDRSRIRPYSTSITDLVGHLRLLGIDCGHIDRYEDVVDEKDKPHPAGWRVVSNTGMAAVIPAWRLYDLLNIEELAMQREQKDKQYQEEAEAEEKHAKVTLDIEKPKDFTQEDYQEALKRASRKIEKDEEQKP